MKFAHRFSLLTLFLLAGLYPAAGYAQKNIKTWLRAAEQAGSAALPSGILKKSSSYQFMYHPVRQGQYAPSGLLSKASTGRLAPLRADAPRMVLRRAVRRKINVFPGKKTVDAVVFDLDGTLLDSLGAWENSGVNYLRSRGIEPPAGLQEKLVQMSLMDGARYIKQMYGFEESPEEILRQTLQPIREHYYRDILPKPGVVPFVHFLRAQGIKLCIATASDRELAEAALKRLGLLDAFDFIITCDEVGAGKQSPAVYEAALKKLGTSKSRTLVAEDALYAVKTAKKAGFLTAGVAETRSADDQPALFREADYYILSFLEIKLP